MGVYLTPLTSREEHKIGLLGKGEYLEGSKGQEKFGMTLNKNRCTAEKGE